MGYFRDIWDRSKDGSRHEQRSFVRYAIVATLIMVVFLLVKKDNLLRWVEAGFTIAGQERKIEKLPRSDPLSGRADQPSEPRPRHARGIRPGASRICREG